MTTAFRVTAFTDTGLVRDHNEDALLVQGWICQAASGSLVTMEFPSDMRSAFVCAVADGMGGHAGGDLASRVALGLIGDAASTWRTPQDIARSLAETNDRVRRLGADPDLRGLGTTVAGISVFDDAVVAFNIGDSRIYNVDHGFLKQVSHDDSVTDKHGRPTNVITQSLGQDGAVEPHLRTTPRDGSSYLICSDGVSGGVSPSSLRAAVLKATSRDCAESIIDMTRANGADDNFSFLLVEVPAVATAATLDASGSAMNTVSAITQGETSE